MLMEHFLCDDVGGKRNVCGMAYLNCIIKELITCFKDFMYNFIIIDVIYYSVKRLIYIILLIKII